MKTENCRRHSSTKFVALTGAGSAANARKNYFILAIIVSTLLAMTGTYFYCKLSINSGFSSAETSSVSSISKARSQPKGPALKQNHSELFHSGFKRKHFRGPKYGESQSPWRAIPRIFVKETLEKSFQDIHDFLNLDLMLHFENIINKNGAKSLKGIFNEYRLKLSSVGSSLDFTNFLKGLKSNKFKFYAGYLKKGKLELKKFQNLFALTDELNYWYNYLYHLSVFLSGYDQQKNQQENFVNCTEANFANFTEATQKQLLGFAYPFNYTMKKLEEINEVINEWTGVTRTEVTGSSIAFYNKVLLLSVINRELHGLNFTGLKSVFCFASRIIYLDEDVELLGTDLAVVAPKWLFLKRIKINLNGPDGENSSGVAGPEQPGNPGLPGGNGGDFLGVGDPHEKFLLISANGGKGGSGQNGSKGQDGADNTRPGPPVNKPTCATKVSTFKNAFGQNITRYKIYDHSGCGGSGMDGGIGGEGGEGGTITLISKNSVSRTKGSKGGSGLPGKGGPGGVGGRDGCFFEAFDVNDETLHRITLVQCPAGNVLPDGEFGKDNHNTQGQILPPAKQNLKVHECLTQFIRFASDDFNPSIVSLIKRLIQLDVYNAADIKTVMYEFKMLESLDKEFYDLFIEEIEKYEKESFARPVLLYLKSIILGRTAILKKNINYYFIDFHNFLNVLERSVEATTEDTRELKPSLYLKRKVQVKEETLKKNLKRIKLEFTGVSHRKSFYLCELIATIDILLFLLKPTSPEKPLESNEFSNSCSTESNWRKFSTKDSLTTDKRNLFGILENLKNKVNVREDLTKLTDALSSVKESDELSDEEKKLLEALTDEVEHLMALYYFTEWELSENVFLKSLHQLNESSGSREYQREVGFLKSRLVDVMIGLQYSLAMDAAQQNRNPFRETNKRLLLSHNKSGIDGFEILLQEDTNQEGVYGNELKAVFDKYSVVGEFFFWANAEIRKELEALLSGTEIYLKSSLINRHVLDKNFLRFKELRLEFECNRNDSDCQRKLDRILDDFKIKITHSGYSYYNWNGETRVVVSEEMNLEYSFRMRDGKEPELYNAFYKKCQDGEIRLSPFTTWSICLLPINEEADFQELVSFADNVNLRLVGSGTYTS